MPICSSEISHHSRGPSGIPPEPLGAHARESLTRLTPKTRRFLRKIRWYERMRDERPVRPALASEDLIGQYLWEIGRIRLRSPRPCRPSQEEREALAGDYPPHAELRDGRRSPSTRRAQRRFIAQLRETIQRIVSSIPIKPQLADKLMADLHRMNARIRTLRASSKRNGRHTGKLKAVEPSIGLPRQESEKHMAEIDACDRAVG